MISLPFALPAPTSATHSTNGYYIYGIVPATEQLLFELPGLDAADVYTLPQGDLAALVSPAARSDYRGLKREEALGYLVTHQRVLEAVMQELPLLPLKFGTRLADEQQVHALLAQGAAQFRQALANLGAAAQFEVLALWNLERLFQLIAAEPEIATLKAHAAASPHDEELRLALGRAVKATLDTRRAQLAAALAAPLRELARDSISNPIMDDSMVLNLALLVDEAARPAFEHRLDELDAMFAAGDDALPPVQLRLVGPLPPHSFASIEVLAPSSEVISQARALLGLPEEVEPQALKRAYHRVAAQLHPDANPDRPEAATQMHAVNAAYRLLSAYAASQRQQGTTQRISFAPEAAAQTLLITVRRQDD